LGLLVVECGDGAFAAVDLGGRAAICIVNAGDETMVDRLTDDAAGCAPTTCHATSRKILRIGVDRDSYMPYYCDSYSAPNESEPSVNIEVEIKSNYGTEAIYPVNAAAKTLAAIAGTKTLRRDTIAHAKSLGYTVTIVSPVVAL
jgi:hypothetical protein